MPFKPKRKYIPRKPKRKYGRQVSKYRGSQARIPRPIPLKPKSVCQKLVYYNTFHCRPELSSDASGVQQNWFFRISLNNPWLFMSDWNSYAISGNQKLSPNTPIVATATDGHPTSTTTSMPGLKDGFSLFTQYENGTVIGAKVTLSAQPTENDGADGTQTGVLYAVRSSKKEIGLTLLSDITDIQKLPFRQMKTLAGPQSSTDQTTAFNNRNVGAKIVVTHSPKKFNNLQSLRDNERFSFHQKRDSSPDGTSAIEQDFLTVGVVPGMTNYQASTGAQSRKATNFKLSMRVEQTILFTEPLESLADGTGNYSLPWNAKSGLASGFASYMGATAYSMSRAYHRRQYGR